MEEYQQVVRMGALQYFISDLEERDETCGNTSSDASHFILYF
jgi:hypothetical protein